MCLTCPGGLLEDIPDRILHCKSSRKSLGKTKFTEVLLPQNVAKITPHTQQGAGFKTPRVQRQLPARRTDYTSSDEASLETPTKRHNLRQRKQLNIRIPSANTTKPTHRPPPERDPIFAQYDTLLNNLIRKSDQLQHQALTEETRTTNLSKIFLDGLPTATLWRQYCLLPSNSFATATVTKATEVHFIDCRLEPIVPVPEAWDKELKYKLGLLLDAVRKDSADGKEKPVMLEPRLWEKDVGMALRHVRDLAVEVLHRGSYRGKRGHLGLLGELLGLSEKGSFWKGGEEVVGSGFV